MQLQNPDLFRRHCLVNGQWISAKSGETIDVRNPATSELIGTVAALGRDETKIAIDAAALAYPLWREMTAKERSLILRRWFDLILTHQEDLAVIMTTEQGKPLAESRGEILYAASFVEWFAEEGKRVYGDS